MGAVGMVVSSLTDLIAFIDKSRTELSSSLTEYTRQSQVIGRVYIEDSIAKDDIAAPLMGTLNQMYVSYIITALHLDSMCVGGKTVRQRMQLVATESYKDIHVEILRSFGSSEDLASDLKSIKEYVHQNGASAQQKMDFDKSMGNRANVVNVDSDTQRLVCGRLVEINLQCPRTINGSSDFVPISAYIYVQLVPYILNKDVASGFLSANFAPSLKSRWKQLRAGEISFFKDFIFARDLIEKQSKIIKKDSTGILTGLMMNSRNKLFKLAATWTKILPENHNLSNSILVLDAATFRKACTDARISFESASVRAQFFAKTFTMILVVVDPMYGTVDMYFNGIDAKGTYSFDMVNKVGVKDKSSFDLKTIMQAFGQGMTPKF